MKEDPLKREIRTWVLMMIGNHTSNNERIQEKGKIWGSRWILKQTYWHNHDDTLELEEAMPQKNMVIEGNLMVGSIAIIINLTNRAIGGKKWISGNMNEACKH